VPWQLLIWPGLRRLTQGSVVPEHSPAAGAYAGGIEQRAHRPRPCAERERRISVEGSAAAAAAAVDSRSAAVAERQRRGAASDRCCGELPRPRGPAAASSPARGCK